MMSVDGSNIVRVSDEKASNLYHEGWRYVAKSFWKEKVRDVEQPQEKKSKDNKKSNKMSKSQKRHVRKSKK
jgi:hypothetical protein